MNNYFLKRYLKNISKKEIYTLANKYDIKLNSDEITNIYNYIHSNSNKYFKNDLPIEKIISDTKHILTKSNYNKLIKLYDLYKDKI
mgnify:CR=1 FL=1